VGVGLGRAREDMVVAFLDLAKGKGVVVADSRVSIRRSRLRHPMAPIKRAYLVTGMSPQSRTVAQLLKGFVPRGTL
jgi:hypothetical protein